jgi:putative tryptophan/tyrosine transport system substrate-binding protein
MRRREFITLVGGAAAWPVVGRAQQAERPEKPAIGYLSTLSEAQGVHLLASFRRGLAEIGLSEGRNVAIEFRWAEGRFDRLPAMASELVGRPVNLLLGQAPPAALAAKAATTSIPIVFVVGIDPVGYGLVASLNRPGGNATGVTLMSPLIGEKRLGMLRELTPNSLLIAMLVNPRTPDAVPEINSVQMAAQSLGLELRMFNASTLNELDAAFAAMAEQRLRALLVGVDPFFVDRRAELVARVAELRIPAIYPFREFPIAGGLISYGSNIADGYRQAGIYAGRILVGAKAAELPVMQPTKFELVINITTAKALGLEVPPTLLATADEVIE